MTGEHQINKEGPVPVYVQIINWMTTQIVTGHWPPETKLPGEPDLAAELGVSRGSLRKAIGNLVSKGMLDQVHGKGTYVKNTKLEHSWASRLVSTSEELNWRGIPFKTEVLAQEICPPPEPQIGKILQLAPHEQVLHLLRKRSVNDEPVVVHQTFFSAEKFGGLLTIDFTTQTMVTDVLEQKCKLRLSKAEHTISAVSADQRAAEWLGINVGEPILYNEHILYDESGQIIEFSKAWFRGDKIHLKREVFRES